MRRPRPVHVLDLFLDERHALLEVLQGLTAEEWAAPTVCGDWTVHEVALHVLGDDLGKLSRGRDGFTRLHPESGEGLVAFIDRINEEWMVAARRLSPRLVRELLGATIEPLVDYLRSLDLAAMGEPVSWAGDKPAPIWLDVAREYTERWVHQQHIRDAVGRPGLTDPRFLSPVLATFAHALPVACADTVSPPGTVIEMQVTGEAGGTWSVACQRSGWALYEGSSDAPAARVVLGQDLAWRLLTKGAAPREAERAAVLEGDPALGRAVLGAVAIIG